MYFYCFGRAIPAYGLMIAIGVLAGATVGIILVRRNRLSIDEFILCATYVAIGAFTGAKVLYLYVMREMIEWTRILEYRYFQSIMSGGFVFYGGLFGGVFALWLSGKYHKINSRRYLELCIPILPLIHGFGRIGCGLAGCCYGIPYQGIFNVTYHFPSAAPLELSLFPVQYLEAAINFLIAVVLFIWVWNKGARPINLILYLIPYSVSRFFLEYLRYDFAERGMWMGFSTSQWISIALWIISATYLSVLLSKRKSKSPSFHNQ